MNQKLQKINNEIERTKAKISELQASLPELEQKKMELENAEIVKAFRSMNVAPGEIPALIEKLKNGTVPTQSVVSQQKYENEEENFEN